MHDTFRHFIDSLPLRTITKDEERELIRRAQSGDRAAFDRVCEQNARGCAVIAHDFKDIYKEIPFEELFAAGLRALPNAVNSYDENKGAVFMTHLRYWCRANYTKLREKFNPTTINSRAACKIQKAREVADEIRSRGETPDCAEVCRRIGLMPRSANIAKVDRWINGGFANTAISLDEALESNSAENASARLDFIEDEHSDFAALEVREEQVRRALDALDALAEPYKSVMRDWLDGVKQIDTAKRMNITHQYANVLRDKAIDMIKAKLLEV